MNGGAAFQYLSRAPPDLGEAQSALDTIVTEQPSVPAMYSDSIGSLFKGGDQGQESIDMNGDRAWGCYAPCEKSWKVHGVITCTEADSWTANVIGHRGPIASGHCQSGQQCNRGDGQ